MYGFVGCSACSNGCKGCPVDLGSDLEVRNTCQGHWCHLSGHPVIRGPAKCLVLQITGCQFDMIDMRLVIPSQLIRVNSHQRWKQTRNRVCFLLWCELTLGLWCHSIVWSLFFMKWNVTEWRISWNSWLPEPSGEMKWISGKPQVDLVSSHIVSVSLVY